MPKTHHTPNIAVDGTRSDKSPSLHLDVLQLESRSSSESEFFEGGAVPISREKRNGNSHLHAGSFTVQPSPHQQQGQQSDSSTAKFVLYPKRWLVLGSFSLLSLTSAWMWITWSPIAISVAQFWNVTERDVDALSGVYMYVYVPLSFVSLWLVKRVGLRVGLLVGALLNTAGSLVRCFGFRCYYTVYIGTFVCAMAQTFTLSIPPLLAGNWFGAKERGTATSLGVLANQVGTAAGLGVTSFVDFRRMNSNMGMKNYDGDSNSRFDSINIQGWDLDEEKLMRYLCLQLMGAAAALVFVLLFVTTDRPPTPPSAAAAELIMCRYGSDKNDQSLAGDTTECGRLRFGALQVNGDSIDTVQYHAVNRSCEDESTNLLEKAVIVDNKYRRDAEGFIMHGGESASEKGTCPSVPSSSLSSHGYFESVRSFLYNKSGLLFVVSYGLSVGVYYALPTFLSQFVPHWSPRDVGWHGTVYVMAGVVGSFLSGFVIDILDQQYRIITVYLMVGSIISMMLFLLAILYTCTVQIVVLLATACLGSCIAALITVGFEYGTAMAYPADEGAIAGVLECAAELGGFVLVTIGSALPRVGVEMNLILFGDLVLAIMILVFGVKGQSRRPRGKCQG